MKTLRILLPILVMMMVLPSFVLAATIGEMELVSGKVKLTRDNRSVIYDKPVARVPVMPGDRFQTGPETVVKVSMRDATEQVKLYSDTNFQVKDHDTRGALFYLNLGKAFFGAHIQKVRTRFNVRTPTAQIGVKGTEFVVGVTPSATFLYTQDGLVGFSSAVDPGREVLVGQGKASKVKAGGLPSPVVDLPPALQKEIINSDGNEAFEDVDFGEADASTAQTTEAVAEVETAGAAQTSSAADATSQPSGEGAGNVTFDVDPR